ncbi:FecCD family ABC transporter permease [Methylobrevis pamukkalensis]|uniref:Hemin transport system permease protein HmuU n=1 Tax=Methylobrevis pamukkalensis TaxID=1439726 RepID=A0A1E3H5G9_9HYPH|nr:iron ABC transporter permease [Methylobrevis pamukkalensis]ODN70761.1 Hemin transport system permease protein HmuU [Methylobrevis pamukkalensis]
MTAGASAASTSTPRTDGAGCEAIDEVLAHHRRLTRRRVAITLALGLLAVAAFIVDLFSGPSGLSMADALTALVSPGSMDPTTLAIVQNIRLPAALTAVLVGAGLAVAGAELQTVFDNPLAEGLTLGIAPAAAFGAALAIVLGISVPGVPAALIVPINAFVVAFGATLALLAMARAAGGGAQTLLLIGIGLVFTFNALIALLQFVASQQALQQLVFWMLGSLSGARWPAIGPLALAVVVLVPLAVARSWQLTALRLGEERAQSLGIDLRRLRLMSLIRVSLLTAAAVSVVGTIGFVGLIGPHIARILVGEDHRFFLPASALIGALVMSLAAAGSKLLLVGVVVPIGILTALTGLPVFFALILTGRAR